MLHTIKQPPSIPLKYLRDSHLQVAAASAYLTQSCSRPGQTWWQTHKTRWWWEPGPGSRPAGSWRWSAGCLWTSSEAPWRPLLPLPHCCGCRWPWWWSTTELATRETVESDQCFSSCSERFVAPVIENCVVNFNKNTFLKNWCFSWVGLCSTKATPEDQATCWLSSAACGLWLEGTLLLLTQTA